eukprot:1452522-Rhodomonas_salina.2
MGWSERSRVEISDACGGYAKTRRGFFRRDLENEEGVDAGSASEANGRCAIGLQWMLRLES